MWLSRSAGSSTVFSLSSLASWTWFPPSWQKTLDWKPYPQGCLTHVAVGTLHTVGRVWGAWQVARPMWPLQCWTVGGSWEFGANPLTLVCLYGRSDKLMFSGWQWHDALMCPLDSWRGEGYHLPFLSAAESPSALATAWRGGQTRAFNILIHRRQWMYR